MANSPLDTVTYEGPHGAVRAYLARPSGSGRIPAILVLQEGLGVNRHLLGLARRYAAEGYLAFVPDLYSHDDAWSQQNEEDVQRYLPLARAADRDARIAALPAAEQDNARRVVDWFAGRDTSTYFSDVLAASHHLRHHPLVRPD